MFLFHFFEVSARQIQVGLLGVFKQGFVGFQIRFYVFLGFVGLYIFSIFH